MGWVWMMEIVHGLGLDDGNPHGLSSNISFCEPSHSAV